MTKEKVLFVCTGNSARSQMAEGFARAYGQERVEASSAGMEPKGLHPVAVEVMREKRIDISHQRSKSFSEELARTMDYVITVCGEADARSFRPRSGASTGPWRTRRESRASPTKS